MLHASPKPRRLGCAARLPTEGIGRRLQDAAHPRIGQVAQPESQGILSEPPRPSCRFAIRWQMRSCWRPEPSTAPPQTDEE